MPTTGEVPQVGKDGNHFYYRDMFARMANNLGIPCNRFSGPPADADMTGWHMPDYEEVFRVAHMRLVVKQEEL